MPDSSSQPIDTEALKALVDAATPAPWTATPQYPHLVLQDADEYHVISANLAGAPEADAAFIAAARTAVPALLAALEEARRERDEWEASARDAWPRVDALSADLASARAEAEQMRPVVEAARALRAKQRRDVVGPDESAEDVLARVAKLAPVRAAFESAVDTYETQTGGTK